MTCGACNCDCGCGYVPPEFYQWHACTSHTRRVVLSSDDPRMPPGTWRMSHWLHDDACTPRYVNKYTGAPVSRGAVCKSFVWAPVAMTVEECRTYLSRNVCTVTLLRNCDTNVAVLHPRGATWTLSAWHATCIS